MSSVKIENSTLSFSILIILIIGKPAARHKKKDTKYRSRLRKEEKRLLALYTIHTI